MTKVHCWPLHRRSWRFSLQHALCVVGFEGGPRNSQLLCLARGYTVCPGSHGTGCVGGIGILVCGLTRYWYWLLVALSLYRQLCSALRLQMSHLDTSVLIARVPPQANLEAGAKRSLSQQGTVIDTPTIAG